MKTQLFLSIMIGSAMAVAFGPELWEKLMDVFKKMRKDKDRPT